RACPSITCWRPAVPTGSWPLPTSDPEPPGSSDERMDPIMKGETMVINGDRWTVVDVAPAAPLAEMVAALLEDEGFVVMVRGLDLHSDAVSHLGTTSVMTTYVLVPEAQAEAATALIAETVTDYEGPELDALMDQMASGDLPDDLIADFEGPADDELEGDKTAADDLDLDEPGADEPEFDEEPEAA